MSRWPLCPPGSVCQIVGHGDEGDSREKLHSDPPGLAVSLPCARHIAGSRGLPVDPVAVAKTGLQAGRQRRPLPVRLVLLPVVAGLVLALLLESVDAGVIQRRLLHGRHHAVVGVQGPQLVRLLGQCPRALVIHLVEQDQNSLGSLSRKKQTNRWDLFSPLGQISNIWDIRSEGFQAPRAGDSYSLSAR